jgi:cyclophilin family peptidyl-prolyl cis-trans isomerase
MRFKLLLTALAGLFVANAAVAQTPPAAPPPPDPQNILNLDLSTGGRVSILLRPDKAPLAVERIKTLTRRGFYNGLVFHRVIEGFMAQGGDPKGTGESGSDLPDLKAEFNDLPHVRGVMSMARTQDENSANSQFFIMLSPNLKLDNHYTAVGRVISGMAYVDLIEKGEPPASPSKIVKASMGADPAPAPVVATAPAEKARDAASAAADAASTQAVDAAVAASESAKAASEGDAATASERADAAKVAAEGAAQAAGDAAEAAKQAEGKAAIETAIGQALEEEKKAAKPKK